MEPRGGRSGPHTLTHLLKGLLQSLGFRDLAFSWVHDLLDLFGGLHLQKGPTDDKEEGDAVEREDWRHPHSPWKMGGTAPGQGCHQRRTGWVRRWKRGKVTRGY